MNERCTLHLLMHSNPFATRYTRPGAMEFLFPAGQSAESIVAALSRAGWWGQIVGPHGSGKSTLLSALLPELTRQGRQVVQYALRSQGIQGLRARSQEPIGWSLAPDSWPLAPDSWSLSPGSWTSRTQVVVDGYEQLSWWSRWKLKHQCRRAGCGLLITTHKSCGLATVFQTEPSLELARLIVQKLLPAEDQTVSPADVVQLHGQHPTNLRELLFGLYDLYQRRQS